MNTIHLHSVFEKYKTTSTKSLGLIFGDIASLKENVRTFLKMTMNVITACLNI